MARARSIKPGFFKNEELAECSSEARICFIGLWQLSDRDGRLEDRPKRIKAELFPYDGFNVETLLAELAAREFILRYTVDGQRLIQVVNFHKHQNPHHREKLGVLPPPPGWFESLQRLEGGHSYEPAKALGKPQASPRLLTHEPDLAMVQSPADSLTADSLTPDKEVRASRAPACPVEQIIDLYHQELPELPRVKQVGPKRNAAITQLWTWLFIEPRHETGEPRASTPKEGLDWMTAYFQQASQNDFVMGRTPRPAQHAAWTASLDYLMTENGQIQVIEKTQVAQ